MFYISCLGGWTHATSNWFTDGVYLLYVHFALSVLSNYILIVSTKDLQSMCVQELFLFTSFVHVILHRYLNYLTGRVLWVKRNYGIRFKILQRYRGDCCACPTGRVRPYKIVRKTRVFRKIFIKIRPRTTRKSTAD